jgi:hypothetical protein
MTPKELRNAIDTLHWTPAILARACGYKRQGVARWLDGTARVPEPIEDWIRARLRGALVEPPERELCDV